ncbi:MAG: hypothetical protein JO057_03920 [Chloroflexi bacterium]|nr:hypothetical protein [Chloroflexota bacterium]
MDSFLLLADGSRETRALGLVQKLGTPRVERRLQPDVQFHTSEHRPPVLVRPSVERSGGDLSERTVF